MISVDFQSFEGQSSHLQLTSFCQERQESREAATAELRREKTAHVEQCRELTGLLERLRGEKRDGDREIGTFRASLKGQTQPEHVIPKFMPA